jgi:hypothetical protein
MQTYIKKLEKLDDESSSELISNGSIVIKLWIQTIKKFIYLIWCKWY